MGGPGRSGLHRPPQVHLPTPRLRYCGVPRPGRRHAAPALQPSSSRKMLASVICWAVMPGLPTAPRSMSSMAGSVTRLDPLQPVYSITSASMVRNRMLALALASRSSRVAFLAEHVAHMKFRGEAHQLAAAHQTVGRCAGGVHRGAAVLVTAAFIRARLRRPVLSDVFNLPRM